MYKAYLTFPRVIFEGGKTFWGKAFWNIGILVAWMKYNNTPNIYTTIHLTYYTFIFASETGYIKFQDVGLYASMSGYSASKSTPVILSFLSNII